MPPRSQSQAARARTPSLSRASVTVDLRPVGLSDLVRARRGAVALDARAMGGASAKRVQSATKSTPTGHASDGAVAFHGGADDLQLEPCIPSGVMLQNDDGQNVRNVVASASVHYAHASRSHCGFVCSGKSHGKAVCVHLVCASPRQSNVAQTASCDPRSLVRTCVVVKRTCGRVRRC